MRRRGGPPTRSGVAAGAPQRLCAACRTPAGSRGASRAARRTADAIGRDGGRAEAFVCDVSNADAVARLFEAVASDGGRVDILVNNAGIAHVGTIERPSEADFDRLYAVNVKGIFFCARAAVPMMVGQPVVEERSGPSTPPGTGLGASAPGPAARHLWRAGVLTRGLRRARQIARARPAGDAEKAGRRRPRRRPPARRRRSDGGAR